jgi:hypothetical protein
MYECTSMGVFVSHYRSLKILEVSIPLKNRSLIRDWIRGLFGAKSLKFRCFEF